MNVFQKGYAKDAGLDIVLTDHLVIRPGFQRIEMPCTYTPGENEVAFLVPRGSTADKGIFPIMVAIDEGYEGKINTWVYNTSQSESHAFGPGERVFGIVNLVKGKDRAEFTVRKTGERGRQLRGSSND